VLLDASRHRDTTYKSVLPILNRSNISLLEHNIHNLIPLITSHMSSVKLSTALSSSTLEDKDNIVDLVADRGRVELIVRLVLKLSMYYPFPDSRMDSIG
jgi:hypothetical protein